MLTADPDRAGAYVDEVLAVSTGPQRERIEKARDVLTAEVAGQPGPSVGQVVSAGLVTDPGSDDEGARAGVLVVADATNPVLLGGVARRRRGEPRRGRRRHHRRTSHRDPDHGAHRRRLEDRRGEAVMTEPLPPRMGRRLRRRLVAVRVVTVVALLVALIAGIGLLRTPSGPDEAERASILDAARTSVESLMTFGPEDPEAASGDRRAAGRSAAPGVPGARRGRRPPGRAGVVDHDDHDGRGRGPVGFRRRPGAGAGVRRPDRDRRRSGKAHRRWRKTHGLQGIGRRRR